MKHLSSILLAAAFVAGSVTACFKDPTSDLMNGPSQITLTRSAITLRTGDSIDVSAELKDDAGNTYGVTGAEWVSADANVAAVRVDTTIIPGEAFSRAFVRGVAAGGGTTTVTVTIRGVTGQFRVVVLPVRLTASATAAVSGTPSADTVAGVTPIVITVGDTVTFMMAANSHLAFDTTATTPSLAGFGVRRPLGYVLRTPTTLKAILNLPFIGRPWVTHLLFTGPTEIGTIVVDSLQSDSVTVARFRRQFKGTVTQTGDTVFVNAPTGGGFSTKVDSLSGARFGTRAAWVVGRTASQLKLLTPTAVTSGISLTLPMIGQARLDTLYTLATYTTTIPTFPGVITQTGDTMFVAASTGTTFDTASATASTVRFGSRAAWLVRRTTTQLAVMSPVATVGPVTATGVIVGVGRIDSLKTPVNYTPTIPTFGGAVTQSADTMFIAAPTGTVFDTAAATASTVRFGGSAAVVLSRTTTVLKVMSPIAWTSVVTVTNVKLGTTRIDSLKTTASYTINAATFVGTVTTAGKLLDTVRVYAGTGFKFTTAPAASVSNVMIGGVAAWVLLRTADSMYVVAKLPSTGQVGVTNATVGTAVIPPQLNIAGNVVITELPSGELNEPGNNTPGAVAINLTGATAANPVVIYGAIDDASDIDDYFAFTLTAARTVTIQLQFTGTGAGGAANPDLDLYTCNATCSGGFNYAGATGAQPENMTITNLAAGTYNIVAEAWSTGGTTRPYKLIVY